MGSFDDVAKKMAAEASHHVRSGVERENELGQLAQGVADDLIGYLGTHPRGEDIDVSVGADRVTLHGRTSGRTLEIICEAKEAFHIKDSIGGFQQHTGHPPPPISTKGAVTQEAMARKVLRWLQERRAA